MRDSKLDAASLAAMSEFLRECDVAPQAQVARDDVDLTRSVVAETADANGTDDDTLPVDGEAVEHASGLSAERRRRVKNAQAAKRRVRYLTKLKAERKTLRKQEAELAEELKKLRAAYAKQATARNKKRLAMSAWRTTAARQKERRAAAEEQQRRLKTAVTNQSGLIHRMKELLHQQRLLGGLDACEEEQAATRNRKGKALLQAFLREMDSLYAKTNDVIGGVRFEMSAPLTYELTRRWSKSKTFLESADATVIPFSFERTCRAVSLMILAPSYNDELEDPENTAIRTYRLNFSRELGDSATLVIYNAVRRYVEKDRAVFVWRAFAEGQGEFDGLHTVETAWFVVRPLAEEGETHEPKMILESYTRLVPVGFGRPSENDARADKFVKILAKADEADVSDMKQMLGKLLLDEARAP